MVTARADEPSPIEADDEARHDHLIVLSGASWGDYQRAMDIRGERALPRICFLEGQLQLMSPSRYHEAYASVIGRLLEAWCMANDIDLTPYGSWTLEKKDEERGVEPDECYVLGDVAEPERPDLAIEVVWTSGGIDKLEIYRKLDVKEVWFWRKGRLAVYVLEGDAYVERTKSSLFAALDVALIERLATVRPMTKAVRELQAALAER